MKKIIKKITLVLFTCLILNTIIHLPPVYHDVTTLGLEENNWDYNN